MTVEEARNEIPNINDFCKCACSVCTANDWYCPTYCETLEKARRMDFDRIVRSYARNEGSWSKIFRFINRAKVDYEKGR